MSPKRASSKAITFTGFPDASTALAPARASLVFPRNFLELLLLFSVGLLVARPARFEFRLATPQKPSDALRVGVMHAPIPKKPMRLRDRGYLAALHRILHLRERLLRNQLRRTPLAHPA
jgi:hypothetical protein